MLGGHWVGGMGPRKNKFEKGRGRRRRLSRQEVMDRTRSEEKRGQDKEAKRPGGDGRNRSRQNPKFH